MQRDPRTATTTTPTGTSAAPARAPFHSPLFGYTITSPEWYGFATTIAWDGTGSPGNGDPFVDTLFKPGQGAFAVSGPTTATLDAFADASNAASGTARSCPPKAEKSTQATIDGAPARIDESHCAGVFALAVYAVRNGRSYTFVTFDQPENEAAVRAGLSSLLAAIRFDP